VIPLQADDRGLSSICDPNVYRYYFVERVYEPVILVDNGGLASGNYYPWRFFETEG
jgi:hypothetical protein